MSERTLRKPFLSHLESSHLQQQNSRYPTTRNSTVSITPQTRFGSSIMINIPSAIQNSANPNTLFILSLPKNLLSHYMHPTAVLCLIIRVKNIHDVFFCHLLVLFRKTVHYIRYHIQDLCDRILILDIDQLRSAVLDHDHRAR